MVVAPGSTIGILGGGQLGRMLALAAAPLGYRVHVYAPEGEAIAAEVAAASTRAAYDDRATRKRVADTLAASEAENSAWARTLLDM